MPPLALGQSWESMELQPSGRIRYGSAKDVEMVDLIY